MLALTPSNRDFVRHLRSSWGMVDVNGTPIPCTFAVATPMDSLIFRYGWRTWKKDQVSFDKRRIDGRDRSARIICTLKLSQQKSVAKLPISLHLALKTSTCRNVALLGHVASRPSCS